jgi:hypothetical protein
MLFGTICDDLSRLRFYVHAAHSWRLVQGGKAQIHTVEGALCRWAVSNIVCLCVLLVTEVPFNDMLNVILL